MILRLLTFAAIFAIALSQDCGGQWQRFGDTCYLVRSDRQFWGEARKRCQAMSADLPLVKTSQVKDFLIGLLSNTRGDVWIGLSDDASEGNFMWVDNTPLTSPTFWRDGQPNNGATDPGTQDENCVEMVPTSSGKWNDENCIAPQYYVCARDITFIFVRFWRGSQPDNGAGDPGTQDENCVEMSPTSNGKWNDENCIAPQYYVCARDINTPILCDESNGWREYGGKCYMWQDSRRKFADAEAFCALIGGHLASVNSQGEQDFLMSQQSTIDIQYWIGLTDMEGGFEGDFSWTDHSSWGSGPEIYKNWDVGQPDNQYFNRNGDCAAVDHPEVGKWQIDHCTDSKRSFCERVEGTCATGWKQFNGQCYQINGNNPKTWSDAKHYCEAQGAYLITIMSDPENQLVAVQMQDFANAGYTDMYIGLSDTSVDGNFQWISGSSMSYTNWNDGMPADTPGQDDCGSIYTGSVSAKWDVMNCYQLQPFMCKIQLGRPVTEIPPDQEIGSCPTNWQLFGDYCYYFSLEDTTTYSGAQTTCEGMNANLVSIHDENEQSFLSTRADGIRRNLWIGLHDLSGEGNFEWSDSTSIDFTNWAPGEPNNAGNGEDCVHLTAAYHNVGMWNDLECDRQENYICKRHKDDDGVIRTPTPFPTGIFNDKCGPGWEYDGNSNIYNGRCYAFRPSDYKTWSGASLQCRLEGGDLCSIGDFNEQSFVNARMKSATEVDVWFGASDLSAEGGFEWSDGAPFRYLNWNAGEPNNVGDDGEHCVEMYLNTGKWNDNVCERALGYFCKQSPIIQKNFFPYRYLKLEDSDNYKATVENVYPKECAVECLARTDFSCRSFDYDRTLVRCFLSDVDMSSVGTVPTDDSYPMDHYETDFDAPIEPPTPTVDPSYGCPDDSYGMYGDYCYLMNAALSEYEPARTMCQMQSSDLASIRDLNENNYIMSFINALSSETRVWIGMNDLDQEMYYSWTDGSDVTFTNWAYYEPNNSGEEDCVEIWQEKGRWNDVPCTGYNFASVCKAKRISGGVIPSDEGCDVGWKAYMSSCYLFNTNVKSWSSAQSDCSSQGGHLAVINHKYENAYFSSQLGLETTGARYWIGLSDIDEPGMYKWVDNSPILMTNWDDGQPDDSMGQCVAASSSIPKSGFWADRECTTAMPYVCETKRDGWTTREPDNPNPTNPTNLGCSVGWIGYGSYCFKVYEQDQNMNRRTWEGALSFCRDQGGDLASFHSSTEEMYIRDSYLPNDPDNQYGYWIGLNDRAVEGGFTWTDTTPVEYTNWEPGEPNDYEDVEDCVESFMNPGRGWNDQECSDARHWICRIEKNKVPITPPPEPPATECPSDSDWYYSSPYCYYVSDATLNWRRTWADADVWCNDNGGNLVSIHSDEEQAFVNQVLKRAVSSYWIGLREYTVEGDYTWTDSSALDYTNWNPGEPNDHNGEEQCGEVETFDDGRWNDQACGIKLAFVCKRDEDSTGPITNVPTQPPTGNCPQGWYKLLTKCYRIYGIFEADRASWLDAKDYCQNSFPGSNANLATIHNSEQQAALAVMMKAAPDVDVWIGLSDSGSSGKFHWTDGSNLDYTNWGAGQPDGVLFPGEGSGSCVEMMNEALHPGDWNDVNCDNMNAYLCQQPLDPTLEPNEPDIGICEKTGYTDYFNNCFKLYQDTLSYEEARATCEADGTTLATIKDGYDEAFIETMMNIDNVRNAWIGLQDLDKDGSYTWLDNWPVLFTKWGRNEPSMGDGEGCVRVNSDMVWQDHGCENSYSFICKVSFDEMPVTPAPPKGYCPDGWASFGTNCYFFDSDVKRASWPESVYDCNLKYGAKLASIHSVAENNFISKNARTAFGTSSIWIGLNRNDDGGFVWDDDSPVDYVNWANDEPNGDMSGQNCVEMYDNEYGQWNDDDCYAYAAYICQLKQLPYPPGSPGTPGKQVGMSAGAIVGIVIGVTIVILCVSLIGFFLFTRYQQGSLSGPGSINDPTPKAATGFDNALYAASDSSGKVNISSDA
ncbi:macrophage mannose receptor 1-like [Amphiura filiformis]|uniref:macrophage mannose receptor 1-like n=1 Tax=Amphiura filiformis TaxID=82378 RepID=UPI003B21E24A